MMVLALFLPVLIDVLFRQDTLNGDQTILRWGNVIAFLIFDYLLIEIFGKYIAEPIAKIINGAILLATFAFAIIFIIMAEYPSTMPHRVELITKFILYSLDAFPFVLLGLLLVGFGFYFKKKNS